jgi:AsmA family
METESLETPKGKRVRTRTLILAALTLLVLVIVVPPFVNINHFRHSIVQSISAGLDRPVYATSVELALFPRPAFVLHHFTVAEWPAYGAEPVITADTVTASLRASTLWHRRVEIASLHFDAPSVNLARDSNGQWNFESLIGNSPVLRLPATSSAAPASASPPPFPYVEATDARINFKRGAEKLPFSLEGADLAFWKGSGSTWHLRIRARPVRTDLPAADAGQVLGEASVQTSGVLMDAPIHASLEWRRGQLGEISRLLNGEDSGWRGTVDWTANMQGTLAKALITTGIQVEEFRRAEFIPPSEIDLAAHCQGQYVHADRRLESVDCEAPLGGGRLRVTSRDLPSSDARASARPVGRQPETPASLQVTLQRVSAGFFLELLRHIHPGVSADASATGEVNGKATCEWRGLETLHACWGEVRSTPLTLSLPHVEHRLHLAPLLLTSPAARKGSGRVSTSSAGNEVTRGRDRRAAIVATGVWTLAASHVSLGGTTPATLAGTLTSSGLVLNLDGPADLRDVNQLARALNSPAISGGIHSIRGTAQLALVLRSNWLPQPNPSALIQAPPGNQTNVTTEPVPWFAPSQWSGTVQVHNATLRLASFPGTLQIISAHVDLTPESVEWNGLVGTYAHLPFDGSVRWQIPCLSARSPCERSFTLHTTHFNVDRLQTTLRRIRADSGLLEELDPWAAGIPELPEISGTFTADVLSAGKLSLKKASFQLHLQGHRAELLALSGNVLGGTLSGIQSTASRKGKPGVTMVRAGPGTSGSQGNAGASGTGSAQWGDGAPIYTLQAMLRNIRPDFVAALWHEKWGRGTATVEIRLHTQGWSAGELAQHAVGNFAINWRGGSFAASLPAVARAAEASHPVNAMGGTRAVTRFQRLRAVGSIRDQKWMLDSGQLVLANPLVRRQLGVSARQSLSGTVTFSRQLNLRLQPSGISITGPMDMPVIQTSPAQVPARAGFAMSTNP